MIQTTAICDLIGREFIDKVNSMNFSKFVNYSEPFMEDGSLTPKSRGNKLLIRKFTPNAKLKPNVSIADILQFIEVGEIIQRKASLLLREIERILKDKVSTLFKQTRGKKNSDEYWHTRRENFWRTSKKIHKSENYLSKVAELINNHSKYYDLNGSETSEDIVYEILSFTELSQIFYYYSVHQVKVKISQYFGCKDPDYFSTGVYVLAKFVRNLDFHNKPSYGRVDRSLIPVYDVSIAANSKMLYPAWENTPFDFCTFYGRLSFIVYITTKFRAAEFQRARKDIKQFMQRIPACAADYLGIPKDWLTEPLWKNI